MDEKSNNKTARQPDLRTNLNRLLMDMGRDYERRVLQEIHRSGHTLIRPAHCSVFTHLGLGAVRVTELAERTHVTQQAMGKMLKELERLGYVIRDIDSNDRRAKKIKPTQRGREVMATMDSAVDKIREYYAARVGEDMLLDLERLMRQCIRRLYSGELINSERQASSPVRDVG